MNLPPRYKKVAIIGTGETRDLAPYDDPEWEIWGLNENKQLRADRWFQIHHIKAETIEEIQWLNDNVKVPIYMVKHYPEIPLSIPYPLKEVLKMPFAKPYFTCSFAYQVALAIYENFEEIGLWGVALPKGSPRERTVERMCLEWWLGVAAGRGTKITFPKSDLLLWHKYLYGYNYKKEIIWTKAWLFVFLEDFIERCKYEQYELGTNS